MGDIILILSVSVAFISVIVTYTVYKASSQDHSYLDIDKQYSELLKIALSDTSLRDYERTSSYYKLDQNDEYKKKYEIYAYMCWNLVETIYDRQKDKKGRFKLSETWLPVMFDENRLHYTWYKHNLRLFKPEFQAFVTEILNDIIIIEGNTKSLNEIYEKFQVDFPADERKTYEHLHMLMAGGEYRLLLAKHRVFEIVIGYAFVYDNSALNVLWLDYMAIDKKFQNAGYGTLLFNRISELKTEGNIGIFLEVEIPSEEDTHISDSIRRIRFYERLGAKQLSFEYVLPTVGGGFPMYLYFRPSPNLKMLPKENIRKTISSVFRCIHSDVENREAVLDRFNEDIKDEHFD